MLSESQITSVWESQIAAEVRALYFAELASKYARRKQWITFFTLLSSSGAAVTAAAKSPAWATVVLSIAVSAVTAYAIATSLDLTIRGMAKFGYSWGELAESYQKLWDNVYADDAQLVFESLSRKSRDLGEIAATDAPNDQARLSHWQDHVLKQHHLVSA